MLRELLVGWAHSARLVLPLLPLPAQVPFGQDVDELEFVVRERERIVLFRRALMGRSNKRPSVAGARPGRRTAGLTLADLWNLPLLRWRASLPWRRAQGAPRPDPPGCWVPGCINGPRQRARMEALRDRLGWLNLESDEDKEWVPLLLH